MSFPLAAVFTTTSRDLMDPLTTVSWSFDSSFRCLESGKGAAT